MGCGISTRGPQTPLYLNEFNPPCHELISVNCVFPSTFPPSGTIQNETGSFFDDREHIKQCQIIHINELTLTTDDYLTGIEVQYYLDGGIKQLKHNASNTGKKFVLTLQNSDSIINCELTHEERKIKSVKLDTLEGRSIEWVSPLGAGSEKSTINLLQQRRALVAFRGKISTCIEGLSIYSWRLCGKAK